MSESVADAIEGVAGVGEVGGWKGIAAYLGLSIRRSRELVAEQRFPTRWWRGEPIARIDVLRVWAVTVRRPGRPRRAA